MTSRRPWMKFYPADWQADQALRMCSLAARGLWIECMAVMHRSQPYGHLLVNGQAPTDAQLGVLVGESSARIPELLRELEAAGVFSRTRAGAIYSRRMTRDEKIAHLAVKNGKNGGNPSLSKDLGFPSPDNRIHKPPDKAQTPEAISQIKEEPQLPSGVAPLKVNINENSYSSKPKKKRKSQIPEGWHPNDDGVRFALSKGFSEPEINLMAQQFCDNHRSKGNLFVDIPAAWRTWVNRQVEFRGKARGGLSPKFRTETRDSVLRRISALEMERRRQAAEFDATRVKEIDEQLTLERKKLTATSAPVPAGP